MQLNYNQEIVHKLWDYLERLVIKITSSDKLGRTITLDRYIVVQDDSEDISKYEKEGTTCSIDIEYYYTVHQNVIDDMGNVLPLPPIEKSFHLLVPKLIGNLFIINGKKRSTSISLGNSQECRVFDNGDNVLVQFDYDRTAKKILTVKKRGKEVEPERLEFTIKCNLYNDIEEDISFDCTPENMESNKEYLALSDEQRKKLIIKLDDPTIGNYITYDLVLRMLELGDDKGADNVIDKTFITTSTALIKGISYSRDSAGKKGSYGQMLSKLRTNFGKSGEIQIQPLQTMIDRIFRCTGKDSEVSVPSSYNVLLFDSLSSKITFNKTVPYNPSMTDLICITTTPINNKINISNELNVCTRIKDDIAYIKCYRFPSFEPVEVNYIDYLVSPVLSNTEVNYDDHTIPPKRTYKVKLRQKEYEYTDLKSVLYIEPQSEDKLSLAARQIPMLNMSNAGRNFMGVTMVRQAEELANAEPRLISSGHETDTDDLSILSVKYGGSRVATVVDISNDVITLKDSAGSVIPINIPQFIKSDYDITITFETLCKVGQKVKPGDMLVTPTMSKQKGYNLGMNIRVGYTFYKGLVYEDGVVVSESCAKKMASYKLIDVTVNVKKSDIVNYIRPIGSKVKYGEQLLGMRSKLKIDPVMESFLNQPLGSLMQVDYRNNDKLVPNNIEWGWLTDVKITKNPSLPSFVSSTVKIIDQYVKSGGNAVIDPEIPEKYSRLKIQKVPVDENASYTICFRILRYIPLMVGSKVTNSWGGKGEVSKVLPDDQMPYDEETKQPLEMILNPSSVIKRMNLPQLYECLLTRVIHRIHEKVQDYVMKSDIDGAKKFLKTFYGNKFDDYTELQFRKELTEKGIDMFKLVVGCYFKYSIQTILDWAKKLKIPELTWLVDPELGKFERPVQVGYVYMMRLYQSAEYQSKVTAEKHESDMPYMGKGIYRGKTENDGQRMGEMESWAMMAHNATDFINLNRKNSADSQYIFLNEMLLTGYMIQDRNGLPFLTKAHDRVALQQHN